LVAEAFHPGGELLGLGLQGLGGAAEEVFLVAGAVGGRVAGERRRAGAGAGSRVTASMRRRFAPIEASVTILMGPMKPRAWTWVPPHSSRECSPASRTRTRSPYLSPKNAMAPSCSACSLVVS